MTHDVAISIKYICRVGRKNPRIRYLRDRVAYFFCILLAQSQFARNVSASQGMIIILANCFTHASDPKKNLSVGSLRPICLLFFSRSRNVENLTGKIRISNQYRRLVRLIGESKVPRIGNTNEILISCIRRTRDTFLT